MLQNALCSLAIFILALVVYQSNGDTFLYAYDSAPNTLLAFNALDHHRLDFDNFRGGYFDTLGAHYIFVEARDGKLASLFPVGAALLTAPLYAVFDLERHVLHQPLEITEPVFERYRLHYEKQAANIVAAVAAVLLFLCARRLGGTLLTAGIVTAFFAFGTEMWVIGSQALWQHGPLNCVLLATVYALLAAADARDDAVRSRWLLAAGMCAGFLPVVRPTAALFLIAATGFAGWSFGRRSWLFGCGALIGLAPGIAWNWYFFATVVGGYLGNTHNYVYSLPFAVRALTGLLVSPSKGLLITTPLVVFSIAGAIRAGRARTPAGRLMLVLAIAALALIATYGFYIDWWGGTNFGDRFVSDTAAIAALVLVYVIPRDPLAFARSGARQLLGTVLFTIFLMMSIGVQFAGANGELESEWSAVPVNVDTHTERLWTWDDSQIARDARASYHKFAPNPTLAPTYLAGFDARIIALRTTAPNATALTATAGKPLDLVAGVENRGSSQLYGYTTGRWTGQSRIRIQITNAGGSVVAAGTLYIPGVCAPRAQTTGIGSLVAPAAPGRYELRADVVVNRIDDPLAAPRAPFTTALDVRPQ